MSLQEKQMRLVYNQKIGTRLGWGFGIAVALTFLLGIIAVVEMNMMANITSEMYKHPFAIKNALGDITTGVVNMHSHMKDIALNGNAERLEARVSEISRHEQHVLDSFKVLSEQFLGDKRDIETAQNAFLDWRPIRQEIIELTRNGKYLEASLLITSGDNHADRINELMLPVREFAGMKANQFFSDAQNSKRHHLFIMSGLVVLISGICLVRGFYISRSLTNPIKYIIREIGKVADGNLDHKINLKSNDEVGHLAQAFDDMTEKLKTTTASRDDLDAANQHLQAHEQQLRATNQQLDAGNQQLRAIEQQLKSSNQQLMAKEQQLLSLNHNLNERVKELNGLYGLSKVIETPNITLPEIFQSLAELLPPSWRYPEITCGCVIFDDNEFKTDNFKETQWLQSADIKVCGEKRGAIEVYYLRECPLIDEGPFLKEERDLINSLAERLSRVIERKQAEEEKGEITAEMERMNRLMTGREMRVIEMKKEVNSLLAELGRQPEYKSVLEDAETVISSDKTG
ncbi:MAG: methyl-accepting chemotaxis protein [Candidatus Brocadiia bacterium]|nr:MAG: methyl-accepting chemotaxis protein [Candidatus Brocadiia bacterium]